MVAKITIRAVKGSLLTTWTVAIVRNRSILARYTGARTPGAILEDIETAFATGLAPPSARVAARASVDGATYWIDTKRLISLASGAVNEEFANEIVDDIIEDLLRAGILAAHGAGPVGADVDEAAANKIVRAAVRRFQREMRGV
jgi:hypothetical protein